MWQVLPTCGWVLIVWCCQCVAADEDVADEFRVHANFDNNSNNNNNNNANDCKIVEQNTTMDVNVSCAASGGGHGEMENEYLKREKLLSRRKRFVAFPLGSSFSCAVCLTTGVLGNPNYQYLSMGLNWGFAYDLPNATWVLTHAHALGNRKKNGDDGKEEADMGVIMEPLPAVDAKIKRRHRRELYHKLETVINSMGYNGRDCVLRALCESRQYFSKTKMGMIGEMLRVVFSLPKQRILKRELEENSEISAYDHAYRKAREVDCAAHYDCAFSLLELAFGKYAKPPPNYYEQFGM